MRVSVRNQMRRGVMVAAVLGAAGSASGADVFWNSALSGAYESPSSWVGGMVPGALDTAVFAIPGAYTVTLSADASVGRVVIDLGDPTFDFTGSRLDLNFLGFPPAALTMGETPGAVCGLTLAGGDLAGDRLSVAEGAGSQVSVSVLNASTRLLANERLEIGRAGAGTLSVSAGGRASSGVAFLGNMAGSTGTVTVSGTGSTWSSGALRVGIVGDGDFTISGGATGDADSVIVGVTGGTGTMTVDGTGTEFDASTGDITLGQNGEGTLTVSGGALVRADDLFLASSGSTAHLNAGAGTLFLTGDLVVSQGGVADATVETGASVICQSLRVAAGTSAVGTAVVRGTVTALNSIEIGPGFFNAGTLELEPGGMLSSLSVSVSPNGVLRGAGLVTGPVESAGTVAPTGVLSVTGDYTDLGALGAGAVVYEASAQTRSIEVSGTATLGGTLLVTVEDGFMPMTGQAFTVLSAGTLVGSFSSVQTPSADWTVATVGSEIVATFTGVTGVPADLDGDGAVGGSDLAILLAAWGACPGCPADLDGDGSVGGSDLAVLLAAWG